MSEEDTQRLKEYQRDYRRSRQDILFVFFLIYQMRKKLVFKTKNINYTKNKYYFQKDKNPININEEDTKK